MTPAVEPAMGTPAAVAPVVSSGGRGSFIRESWGELKKVEWPNRAQVVQGTVVVIIACAIVGAFLWKGGIVSPAWRPADYGRPDRAQRAR